MSTLLTGIHGAVELGPCCQAVGGRGAVDASGADAGPAHPVGAILGGRKPRPRSAPSEPDHGDERFDEGSGGVFDDARLSTCSSDQEYEGPDGD